MKKDDKQRLFEVMGRLDKTFKPRLNEGFEEITATEEEPVLSTGEPEITSEKPKELGPEEKLAALTAKIDSLYAMVHGDEETEEKKEAEEEEIEGEESEETNEPEEVAEAKKPKVPVAAVAKVGK